MAKKMNVHAEFMGGSNYLPGIPARDMTKAEWDALSEEDQVNSISLGIHKLSVHKDRGKTITDGPAIEEIKDGE